MFVIKSFANFSMVPQVSWKFLNKGSQQSRGQIR